MDPSLVGSGNQTDVLMVALQQLVAGVISITVHIAFDKLDNT